MSLRILKFSYRFAEQVLNSKLSINQEIEDTLINSRFDLSLLSRPGFNRILDDKFTHLGWERQPAVFGY